MTKLYFSKQLCVTTYTEVCINLPDHAKAAPSLERMYCLHGECGVSGVREWLHAHSEQGLVPLVNTQVYSNSTCPWVKDTRTWSKIAGQVTYFIFPR